MANRIKELRIEKGLTLQQLSHEIHIGKSTLASYESRGVIPRVDKSKALADFFEVSVDYLLGRSEYKEPADKRIELKIERNHSEIKQLQSDLDELQDFYNKLNEEYEAFCESPVLTIRNKLLYELMDKRGFDQSDIELKKSEEIIDFYEIYLSELNSEIVRINAELSFVKGDGSKLENLSSQIKEGKIFSIKDRINPDFAENGVSQEQISDNLKVIPYTLNYDATMKIVEYVEMLKSKKENHFP